MTYYQSYDNDYEQFLASDEYNHFLLENERNVEEYFSNIILYEDFLASGQYENYLKDCENNNNNLE
jgi:hypothetical protein